MHRRAFLTGALSAAVASLYARAAHAQGDNPAMPMQLDSPGMAGEHGMMPAQAPLAASDALPAGALLPTLCTLANQSREPGQFRATLVARPVARPLLPGRPDTLFWQYDDAASAADLSHRAPSASIGSRCRRAAPGPTGITRIRTC
jgi:hypothetical protein